MIEIYLQSIDRLDDLRVRIRYMSAWHVNAKY